MRSRTSPTTRPARRMRSISARDLRVTMAQAGRRCGPAEGLDEARGRAGDADRAVDGLEHAAAPVVVDDLEQRRHLLVHARADGRLGVVGALAERRPVEVADALDLRRVRRQVVDVPVRRADPAVRHALDQGLERDVDVEGAVDATALAPRARRRAPRPGPRVRGNPSRIAPSSASGAWRRSRKTLTIGLVGDQLAAAHVAVRLAPERRPRARRRRGAGRRTPAPGPRVERRVPGPGCPCRHREPPAGRRPSWPRAADPVGGADGARHGQGGHRMKPS